jgi:hypothetical protein
MEMTMFTWTDLVSTARTADIPAPALRAAMLAQWMLESSRGSSELARLHCNFSGLKWRSGMEGFATPVRLADRDGGDSYCAFADFPAFIRGYWRFIGRAPYEGWWSFAGDPIGFIRFIYDGGFATSAGFADAVLELLPEAARLLAGPSTVGVTTKAAEPNRRDCLRIGGPVGDRRPNVDAPAFEVLPHVRHAFHGSRQGGLEGAIVHFDAGRTRPVHGADDPEWGAIDTLEHGEATGYACVTISRSGVIYLPSNMDWESWGAHAGESLCPATGRTDVSTCYVGIKINCPGRLYLTSDPDAFIAWFDARRDANDSVVLNSKGEATVGVRNPQIHRRAELRHLASKTGNIAPGAYAPFTQKQHEALLSILLWLKRRRPRTFRLEHVFGHDEVSPGRKVDPGASLGHSASHGPGSAMTMTQLRAALLKGWTEQLVI